MYKPTGTSTWTSTCLHVLKGDNVILEKEINSPKLHESLVTNSIQLPFVWYQSLRIVILLRLCLLPRSVEGNVQELIAVRTLDLRGIFRTVELMNHFAHKILSWTFAPFVVAFLFHFFTFHLSYSLLFYPFLVLVVIQLIETGGRMITKGNGFCWCSFNCKHSVIFLHFCMWICNINTNRNQPCKYLRWNMLYFAEKDDFLKHFMKWISSNKKCLCVYLRTYLNVLFFNYLDFKCIY